MNSINQVNPIFMASFLLLSAVFCCAGMNFEVAKPHSHSQRSTTEQTYFYDDIALELANTAVE